MISTINDHRVGFDFSRELSREEHAKRWKQHGGGSDFEDMDQFLAKREQQGLLVEGAGVSHQPVNTLNTNGLLQHIENALFPYNPYLPLGGYDPQRFFFMELMRQGVEFGKDMEIAHFRSNVDFGHPFKIIPVENKMIHALSECRLEDPNQPTPYKPRPEREVAELFGQLVQSLENHENEHQIIQKYIIFNQCSAVNKSLYFTEPDPLNRYFLELSPAHHQLLYTTIVKHAPQYEIAFLEKCHVKALTCNMSQPELISWLQHILQLEESPGRKYYPCRPLESIQEKSEKFLSLLIDFIANEKSISHLKRLILSLVSKSVLMDTSRLMGATLKAEFLSGHANTALCGRLISFSTELRSYLKNNISSSNFKKWKYGVLFELRSAHAQKSFFGWKNLPHYEELKKKHPDFYKQFKALKQLFK